MKEVITRMKYYLNVGMPYQAHQLVQVKSNYQIHPLKQAYVLPPKISNRAGLYLYPNKFKTICNILSKAFNKNIELNLIRLHYPYKDSNILANLLALLVNNIKLRRITRKLFKFAVIKNIKNIVFDNKANYIPAYLTGLNINIAGRLMKYKVIPRKTNLKVQKGSSSFGKVNFTDFAKYTSKNRRGAFSITVSSGQNFFS